MKKNNEKSQKNAKAPPNRHEKVSDASKQIWYQHFMRRLCSPPMCWAAVWLALFAFLQTQGCYHFFYLDQENMFLYDQTYFFNLASRPSGLVEYMAAYLIQFFLTPYCGSLILSVLLTGAGIVSAAVVKQIAPNANLFICCLLPSATLLFTTFDFNYQYAGMIAYLLMLISFYFYLHFKRTSSRVVYTLAAAVTLFWIAGATAFLFVACVFINELLSRFSKAYLFFIPPILLVVLAAWTVTNAYAGDYRFMLLADGYYTHRLKPSIAIYFSWFCLPALILFALLMRKRQEIRPARKWAERIVQLTLVSGFFMFGLKTYINLKENKFKELDYYVRMEQWDNVIEQCGGNLNNYLYKCYLNLALSEKGQLADTMFAFDQSGWKGLLLPKSRITHISVILSDIYFSMGHVALSQQMAFEANVGAHGAGNPRMYKRLIQTNLIAGAYPVAEKYIALLEKTRHYKSWATAHRRFLWNDSAVDADPLLGMKRRCIPAENTLAEVDGLDVDLKRIAQKNPAHSASAQYVGALYLLDKDLTAFKDFIEAHYGTDMLPALPKSFQEAVIILAEQSPDYWTQFNVSSEIRQRYTLFRQQVLANKSNTSALSTLLQRAYGDTYWFYYMFKKIN